MRREWDSDPQTPLPAPARFQRVELANARPLRERSAEGTIPWPHHCSLIPLQTGAGPTARFTLQSAARWNRTTALVDISHALSPLSYRCMAEGPGADPATALTVGLRFERSCASQRRRPSKRRERDSNPWTVAGRLVSNQLHSAALPSLHVTVPLLPRRALRPEGGC